MSSLGTRCLGAAAGLVIDRFTGEPPNAVHPVAWFGTAMNRVEVALWADRRSAGIAYAAAGVAAGAVAGRLVRSTTVAVAVCVAGRQLRTTAGQIGSVALAGDLEAARIELPALVGRDPTDLDSSDIAAAVIESVAENSVDAVIAPAFWAVVAGAPGATAYRAINTMDAMVGHLNPRYQNFGWAAARIDDVANYVPARIFAALVAGQPSVQARELFAIVRSDAAAHPSPNAGVAETAMAVALGCELGGPLNYGSVHEERPRLGSGPRPTPAEVGPAIQIANRAELTAVAVLALTAFIDHLRRRT